MDKGKEQKTYSTDNKPLMPPKTSMKCIKTLKGHGDWVNCLIELRDSRLVSGSEDGTIKLWSTTENKPLSVYKGHTDAVLGLIQFTNTQLISCSRDKTVKIWNISNGKEINSLSINQPFCCICSVSDTSIALGGGDNAIRLVNLAEETEIPEFAILEGHTNQVQAIICVDVLKSIYASGSDDNTIKVWDFDLKKTMFTLEGHKGSVKTLTMLRDGRLASGSNDYSIKLWNVKSMEVVLTFTEYNSHPMCLIQISENQLASASSDWSIIIWNITTTAEEFRLEGHEEGVGIILLTQFGQIASGSMDKTIKIWE